MYSKYEEMQVVRNLLKDWARIDKESYEDIWKNIKENVIPKTPFSIEDFESQQQLAEVMQNLHNIQLGYSSTNNALQELAQATSCYEMGYTQESIQSGTADSIATEREKKGNQLFHDFKANNNVYKSMMNQRAVYSWKKGDDNVIRGFALDFSQNADALAQAFQNGSITKEQLIYYDKINAILTSNPEFIESKQQFTQHQGKAM